MDLFQNPGWYVIQLWDYVLIVVSRRSDWIERDRVLANAKQCGLLDGGKDRKNSRNVKGLWGVNFCVYGWYGAPKSMLNDSRFGRVRVIKEDPP